MKTVYIAGRYGRRKELAAYAEQLRLIGYDVRAEWLTGVHDNTPSQECAEIDYDQVAAADIVISFTEPEGAQPGRARGGRHVEFGIALALDKVCIVVGHRENVFHHLPAVEFFHDWLQALAALSIRTTPFAGLAVS